LRSEKQHLMAPSTKAEVEAYLSKHDVGNRLNAAINAAILADSPDPIAFLCRNLAPISMATVFTQLDTDNDGTLTMKELKYGLAAFGIKKVDIAECFAGFDSDGDGKITYAEFEANLHPHTRKLIEKQLNEEGRMVSRLVMDEVRVDAPKVSTTVLVLGPQSQAKESFGAALAAKLGGSVLNVQKLLQAESAKGSEMGEAIMSYVTKGKIVPPHMCLQLLNLAKADCPAPHVLVDFPRYATLVKELEDSLGTVQLGIALSSDPTCAKFGEVLGSRLQTLDAYTGDGALAAAEAAWRGL